MKMKMHISMHTTLAHAHINLKEEAACILYSSIVARNGISRGREQLADYLGSDQHPRFPTQTSSTENGIIY